MRAARDTPTTRAGPAPPTPRAAAAGAVEPAPVWRPAALLARGRVKRRAAAELKRRSTDPFLVVVCAQSLTISHRPRPERTCARRQVGLSTSPDNPFTGLPPPGILPGHPLMCAQGR